MINTEASGGNGALTPPGDDLLDSQVGGPLSGDFHGGALGTRWWPGKTRSLSLSYLGALEFSA